MKIIVKRKKDKRAPLIHDITVFKYSNNCCYFQINFKRYFKPENVDEGYNLHSEGSLDLTFWSKESPFEVYTNVHFLPENKWERKILNGCLGEISRKKQYSFCMYYINTKKEQQVIGQWDGKING